VDWIDLAQDRYQWGAIVNTVMNLLSPQLDSSRRVVLRQDTNVSVSQSRKRRPESSPP